MKRRIAFVGTTALVGALAASACGSDERLVPSGIEIPDASSDVAHDATPPPDSGVDAGPPVRSVETRPRFGSLDATNLLLDGDFEYSGMDTLQYPWFGVEYDWVVTGARCRHGLRCVEIPLDQYIFGAFVWPDSGSVDVEYFAKPSGTGDCSEEVGGAVIPLADYAGAPAFDMHASATDTAPEADGWCHVTVTFDVPSDTGNTFWALLLAPRQAATGSLLIDDASIRQTGAGASSALGSGPSSPELAQLVARARADFAKRPPTPPQAEPAPVRNRTARRAHAFGPKPSTM
jgi:hypothetical protein